ncbi:MAG: SDR family oxidoreductase [Acidobacteriota bacterium]
MSPATTRRVLVTGVSRGLGRALAEGLALRGHTVLGCARSEKRVRELAANLGGGHDLRAVDITDREAVDHWAKGVVERYGAPDLVLNNAAVINPRLPLLELTAEDFDQVLDVNVKGSVYVLRAFLPSMIAAGRGVVVNFSSGWGHRGAAGVAPYCASKFAIEGLTQCLSQELPEGLAAVAFSPGVIHTEMLETAFGVQASRYPEPPEWAQRAIPFLLELGPRDNGRSVRLSDP